LRASLPATAGVEMTLCRKNDGRVKLKEKKREKRIREKENASAQQ